MERGPSMRREINRRTLMHRVKRFKRYVVWPALGRAVEEPVFIVGSTRSGKTLLARLVGTHPDVTVFPNEANHLWHPETHPWYHSPYRDEVAPFWVDPAAHTRFSSSLRDEWDGKRIRTVFGLHTRKSGKRIFINESAKITFLVPYIRTLFPSARFVNVIRDGEIVAWLQANKIAGAIASRPRVYSEMGYDLSLLELLQTCASSWEQHLREVQRLINEGELLEERDVLSVRYEDLCEATEQQIERLCKFLGIDFDKIPLPFPEEVQNRNAVARRDIHREHNRHLRGLLDIATNGHDHA